MNKLTRFIQTFLMVDFFVVVPSMVSFSYFGSAIGRLRDIIGLNIMIWFAVLILFLIMLVFVPRVREKTLKRLANLKDRDEREEYITGKAARSSYIATLSLTIFLLFFSVYSVELARAPNPLKNNKKQLTISMSIGYHVFDKPQETNPNREIIFSTEQWVPSKATMLLMLLFWQLLIFNLTARKEQ
jgi:hypothetical protein